MKKICIRELIVAVPPEIKEQFDQTQLKNSIYRLKLLGSITAVFNLLNWPIYILRAGEIKEIIFYQ